jgi:predicted MFS family arabinose efflux permease
MLTESQQLRVLILLALIQFTNIMDFMVLMPLGPVLMRAFSISARQFAVLVSAYTLAAGVCGLVGSLVFDRIDRKVSLLVAYLGFLIGTIGCALATDYTMLLTMRALAGCFGGVLSGITFAIIADAFPAEKRGYAMGRIMAAFSLSAILGVPLGLFLANTYDWHAPFVVIAMVGSILLLMASAWIPPVRGHLKEKRSDRPKLLTGIKAALSHSNSRLALLMTFAMMLSQFCVIPFIAPYITRNLGFKEANLPYLYFLGGLTTTVTGPLVGLLCDRFGPTQVFKFTGLLFLIPVYALTHVHISTVFVVLLSSTFYFIFSNSRFVPSMTIVSSSVPQATRGSFLSLNSAVQQFGTSTAALVGGLLVITPDDGGPLTGFNYTAYFATVFGVMAYLIGRRIRFVS